MIRSDIWHKYHDCDISKLLHAISRAVWRVRFETILKYQERYYAKYHLQIVLFLFIPLPKYKRIPLDFRAFKYKRKIGNTIMTHTNLSCDNSWCACGYIFCLKIKITKVCNYN